MEEHFPTFCLKLMYTIYYNFIIYHFLKIGLPARSVKCESRNVNLVVRIGMETIKKKNAGLRYDEVYHMKAL